jgi:SAM-dependent methyltransferase
MKNINASADEFDSFMRGDRLYGDDMSEAEILAWYADEGEGYANLGASDKKGYRYVYHALNWWHGYRKINIEKGARVLGFGSAYGEELLPVLDVTLELTIIDPSDAFVRESVHGVPCRYIKPLPSGILPFEAGAFDLVTAFGVLHHVPNVSTVVQQLARVVRPGGIFLLREPVVSMGDWRQPRSGLTRHERGIPLPLLLRIMEDAGFTIESKQLCVFPPLKRIFGRLGIDTYNNKILTVLDAWLSKLSSPRLRYHAENAWQKVRPTSAFLVLRRNS